MTARKAAFDALLRVENGGYSTLTLDGVLGSSNLPPKEKSLAGALFYGVLERRILLGEIIRQYSKKKLERRVEIILRMGLYQIMFLDRIPDRAAVDESVKLCGQTGCSRASGLINAILRAFLRSDKKYTLPDSEKSPENHLSIKYSCPKWIVDLWIKSYGRNICENILQSFAGKPEVFIRTNTLLTTTEKLVLSLNETGVKAVGFTWLKDALSIQMPSNNPELRIPNSELIKDLPAFRDGLFHVQDSASQLCCAILDPQPGDIIYDVCAAPGGKSFTLTELTGGNCIVHSWDIYPHRVALIESGAKRLCLNNSIKTAVRDSAKISDIPPETADKVLCDVPCSGLGVIRRKPDIMLKKADEIGSLPALQTQILETAAELLRPGGTLVYSTCTLNPAENGGIASKFLASHPEFEAAALVLPKEIAKVIDEPENQITIFPYIAGTDGFFIAKFRKKV